MARQRKLMSSDSIYPARQSDGRAWIAKGRAMAQREGNGVFESIDLTHAAEAASNEAAIQRWKARGQDVLARRTALDEELNAGGFSLAQHLREQAEGKANLVWAFVLLGLNGILAVLVLLGLGPWYLTIPLALLVLVTALPVEEFFRAVPGVVGGRITIFGKHRVHRSSRPSPSSAASASSRSASTAATRRRSSSSRERIPSGSTPPLMWARLLGSDASAAVVLVRLMVGGICLSEGIQKFLFPNHWAQGGSPASSTC